MASKELKRIIELESVIESIKDITLVGDGKTIREKLQK